MLRWILTLVGLLPEQPETRRPRPTVKPRLEELENLILPSASPVDAEVTPQMVSMATQVISTIENDVIRIEQMIGQKVAAEVANVEYQWDRLLGIVPNAQNPSLAATVSQTGSGSGSGSSVTTPHNGQNPQLKTITPKSGSGSGSDAMTTAHEKTVMQQVSKVMPMTGSGSGSSSGSMGSGCPKGSGSSGSTDTLEWAPQGASTDAAVAANWCDVTKDMRSTIAPGAGNRVLFNGTPKTGSNSPITWTAGVTVASISLLGGYNALMTINGGVIVNDAGSLIEADADPTDSTLHLYFGDKSEFLIAGGGTITNMTLAGNPSGLFALTGGTMNIAYSDGANVFSDRTAINISISPGAVLSDGSYNPIVFTSDNTQISVLGTMLVNYGPEDENTLIDSGGYSNVTINVTGSGATLQYMGTGGVADTFTAPVLVQNGGTFIVTEAAGGVPNEKLIVMLPQGSSNKFTLNKSVYMTGSSSTVQLSNFGTLECDNDYYQVDGTLETMDATACILQDGPKSNGTATIAGGKLAIDNPNTRGYGELDVNGNLSFAGTLFAAINGQSGAQENYDLLKVSGTTSLQASSTLTVYVNNGPPVNGTSWPIIQDVNGNNIQLPNANFQMPITSIPKTNLNGGVNQNNKAQYLLSF